MRFRHYRGKEPPSFAHPAEEELAGSSTRTGSRGSTSRTPSRSRPAPTAPSTRRSRPTSTCPEAGAYIECTEMRQANTNKKNQKVRKLRERYGEVCTILYRRDFQRLRRKYGQTRSAETCPWTLVRLAPRTCSRPRSASG